jgi:hypothetical protein
MGTILFVPMVQLDRSHFGGGHVFTFDISPSIPLQSSSYFFNHQFKMFILFQYQNKTPKLLRYCCVVHAEYTAYLLQI